MIRITKRGPIPVSLLQPGQNADQANRLLYDQNTADYDVGIATFNIRSDIYNHPLVKMRLRKIQHNKCCFCEKDQTDEFAQVEHYRPKQAFNRFSGDALQRPGYYWLGYNWSNLYFVCGICNNAKSTAFYLEDELYRAHNHNQSINLESPLILDPGGNRDPRSHISFTKEVAVGLTQSGNTTIDVCKLNRESLLISRKKQLKNIKLMIEYIKKADEPNAPTVVKTKHLLRAAMGKRAMFSAMATDFILKTRVSLD